VRCRVEWLRECASAHVCERERERERERDPSLTHPHEHRATNHASNSRHMRREMSRENREQ